MQLNIYTMFVKRERKIEQRLQVIQPLDLVEEDYKAFHKASKCCICQKLFNIGEKHARHHNHFTGQFIRAAYMNCNIQCKQATVIPVIFHGLKDLICRLSLSEHRNI